MKYARPPTQQLIFVMASSQRTPFHQEETTDTLKEIKNCQACLYARCIDCIGNAKRDGSYDPSINYGQDITKKIRKEAKQC